MSAIDRSIGARLRERRETLHISLGDVARLLGVTADEVQRMEDGARRASAPQLFALCAMLNVRPAALYGNVMPSGEDAGAFRSPQNSC